MNIYTKTGDKGKTRIIGKKVLAKDDDRIEAYGSVDELNSDVGLAISLLGEKTNSLHDELEEIQQLLFDAGHDLAMLADDQNHPFIFDPASITWLEKKIDQYMKVVPPIKKFILPGGTRLASTLHIARTVTRRVERRIVALQSHSKINPDVLVFINRLSDYFFACARYANFLDHQSDVVYRNSHTIFR
ncbi:cob(I)yrinic acid a,c-diamide adenosyltransferase [Lentilactobacillus raoultii]|uniref:Corrinoid adenosyltransferase n=1 Tax=Lentilactobacillus raoultii TaxID=1987503 RepID=A0ABW3PKP4_9LACO|nr:cob(I)yrinic acid a,c-diamide adenosyltransferase [Lentilactobacillus raoultii]